MKDLRVVEGLAVKFKALKWSQRDERQSVLWQIPSPILVLSVPDLSCESVLSRTMGGFFGLEMLSMRLYTR